jgi:alpha-ribazole phosphatase
MEIFLVRHTAVDVPKSICYGQTDVGIADTFEAEKAQILHKIKEKWGDIVPPEGHAVALFSSPLTRCLRLAHFLGENLNLTVKTDTQLKEIHFGDWENKAWNTIPELDLNAWMSDFVHTPPTNGESFIQMHNRVLLFMNELQQQPFKKALIVAHGGVIRAIIAHAIGLPLERAFQIDLAYGSVIHLKLYDDKSWNRMLL